MHFPLLVLYTKKKMAFSSIGDLWNQWNIRSFVLLSLFLQTFLILFAPLRKKIANHPIFFLKKKIMSHPIFFLLWLFYLMADWIAAFTIGLISHNQGNSCARAAEVDGALQAFWASFLLLHLGGPDTITAFSLEDSSLWQRHLLSLIFQLVAAIYVFVQIFPIDKSLVIPTMLVFLTGVIKNVERTMALNLSSLSRLRKSVLSQPKSSDCVDKTELVKEFDGLGDAYSDGEEAKLVESIVVKHAYYLKIFKVFVTNLIFTDKQREISLEYFRKVSAMDALRVISVELHFIYEMLYTKALAIRSKWSYIFRFITITANVMALILFNCFKKHRFPKLDVEITYILLFGGIVLDVIALFMVVFSDWTVAKINCHKTGSSKLHSFLGKWVSSMDDLGKPRFATYESEPNSDVTYVVLNTPLIFRRWSESIFACNLLSEKFGESPRKMYRRNRRWDIISVFKICSFPFYIAKEIFSHFRQAGGCGSRFCSNGSKAMIANTTHITKNPFIKKLWIFIFKEVRHKCKNVENPIEIRKIFEAKGDLFLKSRPMEIDCNHLSKYITDANYDTSIIIWHLATEMCYNTEDKSKLCSARYDEMIYSKILSDYMFYLVVNQSDVVSAIGGMAQVTSGNTLLKLGEIPFIGSNDVKGLCKSLFDVPVDSIQSRTLTMVVNLAREMKGLEEKKWKVMSGVWVEMLSYAAIHIKGGSHVQVLSEGGELLAFVWLLMAHFGCFNRPIYHPRNNATDAC